MATSAPSIHLHAIPPARDIPVTFSASLKSWFVPVVFLICSISLGNVARWAAGEKQAAAAEERLLRYGLGISTLNLFTSLSCSGGYPSSYPKGCLPLQRKAAQ